MKNRMGLQKYVWPNLFQCVCICASISYILRFQKNWALPTRVSVIVAVSCIGRLIPTYTYKTKILKNWALNGIFGTSVLRAWKSHSRSRSPTTWPKPIPDFSLKVDKNNLYVNINNGNDKQYILVKDKQTSPFAFAFSYKLYETYVFRSNIFRIVIVLVLATFVVVASWNRVFVTTRTILGIEKCRIVGKSERTSSYCVVD